MSGKEIIESGLLELYALGALEARDLDIVTNALYNNQLLRDELEIIEQSLFLYAQANSITPNPTVKPLLMARIEYQERLKNGEVSECLPILNANSQVEYFDRWLRLEHMQLRTDFESVQINIISDEPDKLTAIVWLSVGTPPETHESDYEKFLIIEGTCNLIIGTETHSLGAGDYLSIPLHINHHVSVTSDIPCKIILQRVKA